MTNYTRQTLTPEDYRTYRLARFGEAGRCGREGVAKAAAQHGVAVRTWYTYEGGSRKPNADVAGAVARWLNRTANRDARAVADGNQELAARRMAANIAVSLPRPPLPADDASSTTRTEAAPLEP